MGVVSWIGASPCAKVTTPPPITAWRSEPPPLSLVFKTTPAASAEAGAAANAAAAASTRAARLKRRPRMPSARAARRGSSSPGSARSGRRARTAAPSRSRCARSRRLSACWSNRSVARYTWISSSEKPGEDVESCEVPPVAGALADLLGQLALGGVERGLPLLVELARGQLQEARLAHRLARLGDEVDVARRRGPRRPRRPGGPTTSRSTSSPSSVRQRSTRTSTMRPRQTSLHAYPLKAHGSPLPGHAPPASDARKNSSSSLDRAAHGPQPAGPRQHSPARSTSYSALSCGSGTGASSLRRPSRQRHERRARAAARARWRCGGRARGGAAAGRPRTCAARRRVAAARGRARRARSRARRGRRGRAPWPSRGCPGPGRRSRRPSPSAAKPACSAPPTVIASCSPPNAGRP